MTIKTNYPVDISNLDASVGSTVQTAITNIQTYLQGSFDPQYMAAIEVAAQKLGELVAALNKTG